MGASEENTKSILQAAKGKVLIIDEAYDLNPTSGGHAGSGGDPFRTAVINTIVSEVHSVPGDDRCVLLLGYEDDMRTMFQKVNAGLSRRFPLEDGFRFNDFDDAELQEILRLKLKQQDVDATPEATNVAMDILARARNKMNFGNAGEVENLISKAKLNRQQRMSSQTSADFVLEPQDFDAEYDRGGNAEADLHELFKDTVGSEEIIAQMMGIQQTFRGVKARNLDTKEHTPTTFIFKGPPGTGKTTTARKIGQVYYDMGFLSHAEVVECSASDLIGQYVGQTGPKTKAQLEKGLGKVLFIDEAYRLGEGHFAKEAVDELVDLITKPAFKGRLVIVLAGYEDQMNMLMKVNPGLASRFTETVMFRPLSPEQCMELLSTQIKRNGIDTKIMNPAECPEYGEILSLFKELSAMSSWGNGRDVQTIAKTMMRSIFQMELQDESDVPQLDGRHVVDCLRKYLAERSSHENVTLPSFLHHSEPFAEPRRMEPPVPQQSSLPTKTAIKEEAEKDEEKASEEELSGRDAGVTDATWAQLMADVEAEKQARQLAEATMRERTSSAADAEKELQKARKKEEDLKRSVPKDTDGVKERLRALELARLARVAAQTQRDAEVKRLEEEKKRQQEEKRKEALAQAKLRQLGVCPVGFRWIKQAEGYRCAGGSHFVDNAALEG